MRIENRFYSNDEVATFFEGDFGAAKLAHWPLVNPPVCPTELAMLRDDGHSTNAEIEEKKLPQSGFRTNWGFVTVSIENDDGDVTAWFRIYLDQDALIGEQKLFEGPTLYEKAMRYDMGSFLSDWVANGLMHVIDSTQEDPRDAGGIWTDPGTQYLVAELMGAWSDEQRAHASLGKLAAIFARVIRSVDRLED